MCQPASGRLQRPGLATGRGISDRAGTSVIRQQDSQGP